MATRNIVPRGNGEGSLGTAAKAWGGTFTKKINNVDAEMLMAWSATLFRLPETHYDAKTIKYSPLLPAGWFLECKTAGTTGSGSITLPDPFVENAEIEDGTVVWRVRKISSADGVPLGVCLPLMHNDTIPSGYLLCDGQAVSRTMYADLFAKIGTLYGNGDGETTFNLPDQNQAARMLQGSTTAGTIKAAGLPNISGDANIGGIWTENAKANNETLKPFTIVSTTASRKATEENNSMTTMFRVGFDASHVNSIYGNSTTVQPPATTCRYVIKAFDGQTADSALVDVTQYANELAGKADRSLSNLTDDGKSFPFPSGTYVETTSVFSTNGSIYTAPADGYVAVFGNANADWGNVQLNCATATNSLKFASKSTAKNGAGVYTYVPVMKGDKVTLYIGSLSNCTTKFIYAAGEVPTT